MLGHISHIRKILPLSTSFCLQVHGPEECLCDVSQAVEGLYLKITFCEMLYKNVSSAIRPREMSIIVKNKTDLPHSMVCCNSEQSRRTCKDQRRVTREIKALQ